MELEVKAKVNEDMTAEEFCDAIWKAIANALVFMNTDKDGDLILLDTLVNKLLKELNKFYCKE